MVEALASKTLAWEKERGIEFTYDGVRIFLSLLIVWLRLSFDHILVPPSLQIRLLSMLEEYTILREEREQERRRLRVEFCGTSWYNSLALIVIYSIDHKSIPTGLATWPSVNFEIGFFLQDQKKLQGQLIAEQEALYGSKPSPSKTQMVKKAPRMSTGGASTRRLSLGGAMIQTPKTNSIHSTKGTPHSRATVKNDRFQQNDQFNQYDTSFAGLSAGKLLC